jgi:hypothetical protein
MAPALALALLLCATVCSVGGSLNENCDTPPPGHMQPLGGWPRGSILDGGTAHRPAKGSVRTYSDAAESPPGAGEFWRDHVDLLQPALFKRMATRTPAYSRWTDAYLTEQFGKSMVKVEYRRENRLSDYCGMEKRGEVVRCPEWKDSDLWKVGLDQEQYRNLGDFLDRWNDTARTEEYVISSLPSPMRRDITIPPTFLAGGGDRHPAEGRGGSTPFYEANLWMSHSPPLTPPPQDLRSLPPRPPPSRTDWFGLGSSSDANDSGSSELDFSSSVVHYDQNHQVMCVLSGVKEWIFIDPLTEIQDVSVRTDLHFNLLPLISITHLRATLTQVPMWSDYYRRPCLEAGAFRCDDEQNCCPGGSDDSPIDGEKVDLLRFPVSR